MWRAGCFASKYYLKPKQRDVITFIREHDDPFVEAARRFGKTTSILGYVQEECIRNPGIIVKWCEPWKNQCREIVIVEMDQMQKDIPIEDRFHWRVTDSYYEHKNGSRIYLRGVNEDRGESARGSKAHIVVVDELGSWKDPTYIINEVLIPQLRTTKGKLIKTGTPPRMLIHKFYEYKDQAILDNNFIQRKIQDQELVEWGRIEHEVRLMGGWQSTAVRRELLCEKIIDESLAIVPEWNDKYIKEAQIDEFYPFYVKYDALDIGVRDFSVCLFAYYDFRLAKIIVLDEVLLTGKEMTTEKLAELIREKEKEHFGISWESYTENNKPRTRALLPKSCRIKRVSDIDLRLVNDMSLIHGIYFEPTDKGRLEEEMVNELRIWVGAGRVLLHPRCVNTAECLKYGIWDEHRSKWERSEKHGHFDALAALMYLIRNIDSKTNPIPTEHGKPAEDYFFVDDKKSDKKEIFKKMMNLR